MKTEVLTTVNFLTGLIRMTGLLTEDHLRHFSFFLKEALFEHYQNHWFPKAPCRGSGYRCLRINHKMDPLIGKAGRAIGISQEELLSLLPSELTVWVDPNEVSYRIGENGSTCVLYKSSTTCTKVSPDMTKVPALPKETTYLYARFNKITKITNKDFADFGTLKRIDLTGNLISEIEDGAFSKLEQLEELTLAENRLIKLPMLPPQLISLNANHNKLKTKGVRSTVLKKLPKLAYLYLGDNELEAIPPLPESLHVVHLHNNNITTMTDETFCKGNDTHYIRYKLQEVRLDGNPMILAQHPNSFICLRSLPIGLYK
ncbi:Mimecan [Bagarius yarrelli]|uniref:Mimecan n=1 Tax=Bagarius yarrelli TaxID=175774 RepID=A0A556U2F9_BAGYA|nr:Mimecan [Bagarius yarrelli]